MVVPWAPLKAPWPDCDHDAQGHPEQSDSGQFQQAKTETHRGPDVLGRGACLLNGPGEREQLVDTVRWIRTVVIVDPRAAI